MAHLLAFSWKFSWPADGVFLILSVILIAAVALSQDKLKAAAIAYVLTLPTVDLPGTAASCYRGLTILGLSIFCLGVAWFAQTPNVMRALARQRHFIGLVISFFLWCVLSQGMAEDNAGHWGYILRLAGLVTAAILFSLIGSRRDILHALAKVFVLQMALISIVAVVQAGWGEFVWGIGRTTEPDYDYFIGTGSWSVRAPGLFVDPNNLGLFCAVALLLLYGKLVFAHDGPLARLKAVVAPGLLNLLGLVVSQTRTAVGALIVAAVALPFKRLPKVLFLTGAGMVMGLLFFLRVFGTDAPTTFPSSLLGARIGYWQACLELAEQSPMVGVGLGHFSQTIATTTVQVDKKTANLSDHRPHNLLLGLLAETGIVGTLLFMATAFYAVAGCTGGNDELQRTVLSVLCLIGVHAMLHNIFFQDLLWSVLGTAAGVGRRATPAPRLTLE